MKFAVFRKQPKEPFVLFKCFVFFGIIAALVTGAGMCLSMKVIGSGTIAMFVLGVIIGIIGLLGMGINYPIFRKILNKGKQKYAFEIMELAKEISGN